MFLLPFMKARLESWEDRPLPPGAAGSPPKDAFRDRHERIVAVESPGEPEGEGPFIRVARSILGYEIFPARVGQPVVRRAVQAGDSVGLRYHLLPGLDLFFASRVVRVFTRELADGWWSSGFTYQTLQGHPEVGEETFSVLKRHATGEVRVLIFAWSRPAWPILMPVLPLARYLQLAAGRSALDNLEQVARSASRAPSPV
ncbi:DUF1990 family protein [bacterium CPR1]|nr:DUF1990 family protein [bacterium CPR1]